MKFRFVYVLWNNPHTPERITTSLISHFDYLFYFIFETRRSRQLCSDDGVACHTRLALRYRIFSFFFYSHDRTIRLQDRRSLFVLTEKKTQTHFPQKSIEKSWVIFPSIPLSLRVVTDYYFRNTWYKKIIVKNHVVRFRFYLFCFIRTFRVFPACWRWKHHRPVNDGCSLIK